jgi:hypothetical protein
MGCGNSKEAGDSKFLLIIFIIVCLFLSIVASVPSFVGDTSDSFTGKVKDVFDFDFW